MPFVPEFSAEFSAPPEFSAGLSEKQIGREPSTFG
jgi:hypothetical protein